MYNNNLLTSKNQPEVIRMYHSPWTITCQANHSSRQPMFNLVQWKPSNSHLASNCFPREVKLAVRNLNTTHFLKTNKAKKFKNPEQEIDAESVIFKTKEENANMNTSKQTTNLFDDTKSQKSEKSVVSQLKELKHAHSTS